MAQEIGDGTKGRSQEETDPGSVHGQAREKLERYEYDQVRSLLRTFWNIQTQLSDFGRDILDHVERLLQTLEPKSSFHDTRDLDQFRHFAEEVKGLMDELSGSNRMPKEDIELVIKGLSPAKTLRILPKKP